MKFIAITLLALAMASSTAEAWGGPSPAPPAMITRPSNRAQVKCTWWCPSGYTRRDVTIGPSCSFWRGGLGKCVDRTRYLGEGCDDSAHTGCGAGGRNLVCQSVAQNSAASNACACSRTCQRPGRQLADADAASAAPQVAARMLTAASRRRMLRAFDAAKRRRLIGRGTMYCREDAPMGLGGDCYTAFTKERASLPACSFANLNRGKCLCAANAKAELRGCDIESGSLRDAKYKVAHCADRVEYIARGATSGPSVCKRYVLHDQWHAKDLTQTRAVACASSWWPWACCGGKWGYTWRNGRCEANARNLGEKCGDEWGICKNSGVKSYDGHHLSCYKDSGAPGGHARCVPSLYSMTRNQCSCAAFSWYFFVACGSNGCNGHSCVLSTGDGNKYCDYQTGNDW